MASLARRAADIRITEYDLSTTIAVNSNATALSVGVSARGPVVPTFYSNFDDFRFDCGDPNAQVSFDHYAIRDFFREILELLFQAAALVIDTVRTFFLVVLAILGPIAFALSVWDGFQNTLTQWICRYIQVYLWLPVSDMFSTILAKIQVLMLQNDIERMQADPNFSLDSSDGVYIVFLCIGIIGYFTIPTVAGWIIQAGGMGGYGRNVNQMAGRAGSMAGSVAGAAAGNAVGRVGKLLK